MTTLLRAAPLRTLRTVHRWLGIALALPLFAGTGLAMWVLKRRNRRRIEAVRQAALQPSGASPAASR